MPTKARMKSLWSVKSSWRWILKSLICWHHISNIWTRKVWGEKKVDRFILVDISLPIPELLQKKISVHSTYTLVGYFAINEILSFLLNKIGFCQHISFVTLCYFLYWLCIEIWGYVLNLHLSEVDKYAVTDG